MVSDATRMEAIVDKPSVIVTDRKVGNMQEFLPLLEQLAQAGKKDIILIAEDVEGDVLGTLILNKLKGVLNVVAVKAPSFGDNRSAVLEDIAILTGGQVIAEDQGMNFDNVDVSVVGTARKIIVTKDETTIIEGAGKTAAVRARIEQISNQANQATSEYDKESYDKRRAALQGKVAVIKVGGATETEIEEKKFRVDDAVAAVKAALDEGIVPGGGVTLVTLSDFIKIDPTEEVVQGKQLLKTALLQPFYELLRNSGLNPDEWLPKIRDGKTGQGIDVNSGKLVDLKAKGIVDPKRVTREAIQNSVSIAGTAITMGALVVEVPKEEATPAGGGMPGGMGMM